MPEWETQPANQYLPRQITAAATPTSTKVAPHADGPAPTAQQERAL
jgi:hypothetical protein